MLYKEVKSMRRFNISMGDDTLARIDTFCKSKGLTRSALLTMSAMAYIEAQEAMPDLQKQIDELKQAMEQLTIK